MIFSLFGVSRWGHLLRRLTLVSPLPSDVVFFTATKQEKRSEKEEQVEQYEEEGRDWFLVRSGPPPCSHCVAHRFRLVAPLFAFNSSFSLSLLVKLCDFFAAVFAPIICKYL